MQPLSFNRHRFPPEIIRHAIWLYGRFTLSFGVVEELLAERGVDVSYETVQRRFLKFGLCTGHPRAQTMPTSWWPKPWGSGPELCRNGADQWRPNYGEAGDHF